MSERTIFLAFLLILLPSLLVFLTNVRSSITRFDPLCYDRSLSAAVNTLISGHGALIVITQKNVFELIS